MATVVNNNPANFGAPGGNNIAVSTVTTAPPVVQYEPPSAVFDQLTANSITDESGSSGVNEVSNTDGTLTVSPTAGNVVVSLALNHANTWTGIPTISTHSTSGFVVQNSSSSVVIFRLDTVNNGVNTVNNVLDDGSGKITAGASISPGNAGTAGTASHLFSGTGTPQGNVTGVAGDYYLRVDGGVSTHLYICTGTTNWTGIV